MKEATELKQSISKFCRAMINHNRCGPDICEFCYVNHAYEVAKNNEAREDEEQC